MGIAMQTLERHCALTGQDATIEEVIAAMIQDGDLAVAGIGLDGEVRIRAGALA